MKAGHTTVVIPFPGKASRKARKPRGAKVPE